MIFTMNWRGNFNRERALGSSLAQVRPLAVRGALLALALAVLLLFVARAVTGPTGVLAWRDYHAERQRLEAQVAQARQARAALERDVALLNPNGVDQDIADELARRNLNLARPDEVIVLLPPEPARTR
jgi:cell division protein FtsB